jgi:hypothetical protein
LVNKVCMFTIHRNTPFPHIHPISQTQQIILNETIAPHKTTIRIPRKVIKPLSKAKLQRPFIDHRVAEKPLIKTQIQIISLTTLLPVQSPRLCHVQCHPSHRTSRSFALFPPCHPSRQMVSAPVLLAPNRNSFVLPRGFAWMADET